MESWSTKSNQSDGVLILFYDFEYEFEEVDYNGGCYTVKANVEYDGAMVDNGIGPYEFWGAKCTEVRIESEIDKIDYDGIELVDDNAAIIELNDDEKKKVKEACEAHFKKWPDYWGWIEEACESDFEVQMSD